MQGDIIFTVIITVMLTSSAFEFYSAYRVFKLCPGSPTRARWRSTGRVLFWVTVASMLAFAALSFVEGYAVGGVIVLGTTAVKMLIPALARGLFTRPAAPLAQ